MNDNYTYIIASMPPLQEGFDSIQDPVPYTLEWIRSQLTQKDRGLFDLLCEGFVRENLTEDFYLRASGCRNEFIRGYFARDLALRNGKVRYLNRELGQSEDTDVMESPFREEVAPPNPDLFTLKDILSREKDIDRWLWDAAQELTRHKYFTLDNVLSFVVKLNIIHRWLSLDREQGRRKLEQFVREVRGSYGQLEFDNRN